MLKQGKRHRHRILANASPLQAISLMHLSALLLVLVLVVVVVMMMMMMMMMVMMDIGA